MITALALSQMDTGADDEALERAREGLALGKQLQADREALATLQQQLAAHAALVEQAGKLQWEIDRLSARWATRSDAADQREARVAAAREELARLQAAMKELEARTEQGRIAVARVAQEEARRRQGGGSPPVKVMPSGSGMAHRNPTMFVEALPEGLRWHRKGGVVDMPLDGLAKHPALGRLFGEVKGTGDATLIFLVREQGIASWRVGTKLAGERGVRHGNLPVFGEGDLDLSIFGVP
jgi:hypothetical protein